jgi:hypothetical protein
MYLKLNNRPSEWMEEGTLIVMVICCGKEEDK